MIKPVQNQDQHHRIDMVSEQKNHELRADQLRGHMEQKHIVQDARKKQEQVGTTDQSSLNYGGGHKDSHTDEHRQETHEQPQHRPSMNGGQLLDLEDQLLPHPH